MIARKMARLFAAVVLIASGTYFFVYLWRWEWNRAIVAGILFLAAEIGLSTSTILDRLRSRGAPGAGPAAAAVTATPDPAVVERIRETAPPARDHFAWLSPKQDQMGVFVPVLMGMGVVASALAWVIEKMARATARPALEKRLAARLSALSWPTGGLTRPETDPVAILARPVARRPA